MTKTPAAANTFFGVDINQLLDKVWLFRRQVSKSFLLVEFARNTITLVEASYSENDVKYTHLRRVQIPENAVERGVPSEPALMAELIKNLCKEEKIYAKRTAVVLPPEAAFCKLIDIPAELTIEEARAYANSSSSGIQIAIPLKQTDFDIIPTGFAIKTSNVGKKLRTYYLTSVPKKLIDQLLTTMQLADLELHLIELGFFCQLRLMAADTAGLMPNQYLILLELLPNATHLTITGAFGPVAIERIAAIREFPQVELSSDGENAAIAEALSGEALALGNENYMPISELDLRVIIREVSNSITNFKQINANTEILGIALSGINSAHPLIDDLLSAGINLPVRILRPIGASCVQSVSFKQLIVHQSIGRIIGLGLGLLPHESLISCSITEKADHHLFETINKRDLIPEPIEAEEQEEVVQEAVAQEEVKVEVENLKQEDVELQTLELMLTKEETKLAQIEENIPEEEWPSIKNIAPKEIEETKITKAIAEKEEEWPSLGLSFAKEEAAEQETKAEQKEEKQAEVEESMPEDEWPSLNLTFASEGEDDNNK
jgi:Tfp pilus assembly PilM family ATPase